MTTDWESLVNRCADAFRLPSVAAGIYTGGKECFITRGRAGICGKPVTPDTVYPIASASKAFIATAVMLLQERDLLDLDAPVARYLPDFALYTQELTDNLTVRDMLCHRSGLPRHDLTLYICQNVPLEEMVRRMRYLQPAWPLRQRFCYQNHMFAAVSLLVERVTGVPWGQYVEEAIFKPLGMERSYTLFHDSRWDDNYARPLAMLGGLKLPIKAMNTDSTGSAGSISGSCRDMLRWAQVNLLSGVSGKQVISKYASAQLHGQQMPIKPGEMLPYELPEVDGCSYGLGWFVEHFRGEKLVHHGGTVSGYKSLVGFMPEKDFAFVILCNANNTLACTALGYALCDAALGVPDATWFERYIEIQRQRASKAKQLYRERMQKPDVKPNQQGCAGRYANGAYGVVRIAKKGRRFSLEMEGQTGKAVLAPSRADEYVLNIPMAHMALPCRFERKDGIVTALEARFEENLETYIPFARLPTE